jgi:hypothetical protein
VTTRTGVGPDPVIALWPHTERTSGRVQLELDALNVIDVLCEFAARYNDEPVPSEPLNTRAPQSLDE